MSVFCCLGDGYPDAAQHVGFHCSAGQTWQRARDACQEETVRSEEGYSKRARREKKTTGIRRTNSRQVR